MTEIHELGPITIEVGRPDADEYDPAFAGYVARLEDDESVVTVLSDQIDGVACRFSGAAETRGDCRCPGEMDR